MTIEDDQICSRLGQLSAGKMPARQPARRRRYVLLSGIVVGLVVATCPTRPPKGTSEMLHCVRSIALSAVLVITSTVSATSNNDFRLTDKETAITIAKAVFRQRFGDKELRKIKFCEATLGGDKWIVYLHPYKRRAIPPHGGTFDIEIAVERAAILSISAEM